MILKNLTTYGFVVGVFFSGFLATKFTEKNAVFIESSFILFVLINSIIFLW